MRIRNNMLPVIITLQVEAIRLDRQTRTTETTTNERISRSQGVFFPFPLRFVAKQLSFTSGDALLVHAKPSPEWWWAELRGVIGYVPASYLCQDSDAEEEEEDTSTEDPWQDEEYFGSYSTLVRTMRASPKSSLWWTDHRFSKCFFIFVIEIISLRTETLLKGFLHASPLAEAPLGNAVGSEPHGDVPPGPSVQPRLPEEQSGDGPRLWDWHHQSLLCPAGTTFSGNNNGSAESCRLRESVWRCIDAK